MIDYEVIGRRMEEVGYPILCKFNQMNDDVLKETLRNLVSSDAKNFIQILSKSTHIERVVINMKIDRISISFYDKIVLNTSGILYYPEHGVPDRIFDFNEYFRVPVIGGTIYKPEDATIG